MNRKKDSRIYGFDDAVEPWAEADDDTDEDEELVPGNLVSGEGQVIEGKINEEDEDENDDEEAQF